MWSRSFQNSTLNAPQASCHGVRQAGSDPPSQRSILLGFLTWYCDVASVHGALFMSNPNFWARRKPRRHSSHGGGGDDTDVEFERLAVTHASPEMVAEKALLVNHLSKSYKVCVCRAGDASRSGGCFGIAHPRTHSRFPP